MTVSGSYRDIRQFLYQIETTPAFLVIRGLAFDQIGKSRVKQAHDHRGKDICHHKRRPVKGELSFSDLIHGADAKDEFIPHFVCICIFARVLHRPGIDIHTQHSLRAQLDRSNRENAGAAANIDHGQWAMDD